MATLAESSREIGKIKREIKHMQRELSDLLRSTGSYSRGKLLESKERLQAAINNVKERMREKAAHAYESCKEQSRLAVDKSRHAIERKPFTSVLVAFFAGAVLVRLLRRRHTSLVQESSAV